MTPPSKCNRLSEPWPIKICEAISAILTVIYTNQLVKWCYNKQKKITEITGKYMWKHVNTSASYKRLTLVAWYTSMPHNGFRLLLILPFPLLQWQYAYAAPDRDFAIFNAVVLNSLPLTMATFARHTCFPAWSSASEDFLFCVIQIMRTTIILFIG